MPPRPKLPSEDSYQHPYGVALNECLKDKQVKALDQFMGKRPGWTRSRTSGKYFSGLQELEKILGWPKWSDEDRRRIRAGYETSLRLRDQPGGQWRFDVIGIGALNYDHILTAEGYRQWALRRGASTELVDLRDDAETVVHSEAEIIDDLADIEDFVAHSYGGSAFNTIRLLATRSIGARVDFVGISGLPPKLSVVADGAPVEPLDPDGRPLERHLERLKDLAVPCVFVDPVDEVGGRCNSRIVPDGERGERRMCTWQGANEHLGAYVRANRAALASHLASSQWVHVSSLIDVDSAREVVSLLSDVTGRLPVRISFDPGELWCRTERPYVRELLALTSLLFVNAKELGQLVTNYCGFVPQVHTTEERAQEVLSLLQAESSVVVVKQQGQCLVASNRNGQVTTDEVALREPLSNVEDDTGAGDAFAAGYLSSLFESGLSRRAGALLGMQLAKAKVSVTGPPPEAEIKDLINNLRLVADHPLPDDSSTGR